MGSCSGESHDDKGWGEFCAPKESLLDIHTVPYIPTPGSLCHQLAFARAERMPSVLTPVPSHSHRSLSGKRFSGLPSLSSSSWSAPKSPCTVSCPPTPRILFTGCVPSLPPTVEPSWNSVSPPLSPRACSCSSSLAPTSLRSITVSRRIVRSSTEPRSVGLALQLILPLASVLPYRETQVSDTLAVFVFFFLY